MSYLVLARKYRPGTFEDVVAQPHITKALKNAIKRDKIPHALLFSGPRGVGKTSCARILAKALNCPNLSDQIEPCNKCANCIDISKGIGFSVREIDGASNNSVDNIRELTDSLYTAPPEGFKYKIYIIDEVHMLSISAFNALLKSLEEPPDHTLFVFATTEPHKIPETVLSRLQRHDFRRISNDAIAKHLIYLAQNESLQLSEEAALMIASISEGAMRDAQSMLDRLASSTENEISQELIEEIFGVHGWNFFTKLSEYILNTETKEAIELIDQAYNNALETKSFFSSFVKLFRNLLLIKLGVSNSIHLGQEDYETLKTQAERTDLSKLQKLFQIAQTTADEALRSNFSRYILEAAVVEMSNFENAQSTEQTSSPNTNNEVSKKKTKIPPQKERQDNHNQKSKLIKAKDLENTQVETSPLAREDINWEGIIEHTQKSGELLLCEQLKRAKVEKLTRDTNKGNLHLCFEKSIAIQVKDPERIAKIENILKDYSKIQNWDIKIIEGKTNNQTIHEKTKEVQKQKKENFMNKVENLPEVQNVIKSFPGSKIIWNKIKQPGQ